MKRMNRHLARLTISTFIPFAEHKNPYDSALIINIVKNTPVSNSKPILGGILINYDNPGTRYLIQFGHLSSSYDLI